MAYTSSVRFSIDTATASLSRESYDRCCLYLTVRNFTLVDAAGSELASLAI